MPLIIRKATVNDAGALAEILTKSWLAAYKTIIPAEELQEHASFERRYEMLRTKLDNGGNFYIALNDGVPYGHIMFCPSRDDDLPDDCEIVAVYAIPEYWDKGVGRKMMAFALTQIRRLNYKQVFLWVFKENGRARKFYEKFGFSPDGVEKAGPFSNGAMEVRYVLNLDQAVI